MLRKLGFVVLCITLTGCAGFQLRGNLSIPDYLQKLYISPCDPNDPLQNILRARLKDAKVKVLNQPVANVAELELSRITTSEQVLAYGSSGEAQRYQLNMYVTYDFRVKSKGIHVHRTITRTRELNRSNNMLLSNEGEEQLVKKELLNETASELLRQITTRPLYKESVPHSSTTDDNPC